MCDNQLTSLMEAALTKLPAEKNGCGGSGPIRYHTLQYWLYFTLPHLRAKTLQQKHNHYLKRAWGAPAAVVVRGLIKRPGLILFTVVTNHDQNKVFYFNKCVRWRRMAVANICWNTAHLHHKDILGLATKEEKNAATPALTFPSVTPSFLLWNRTYQLVVKLDIL